jgi:hypothetical protein
MALEMYDFMLSFQFTEYMSYTPGVDAKVSYPKHPEALKAMELVQRRSQILQKRHEVALLRILSCALPQYGSSCVIVRHVSRAAFALAQGLSHKLYAAPYVYCLAMITQRVHRLKSDSRVHYFPTLLLDI